MIKNNINIDFLNKILRYDNDTGMVYWKERDESITPNTSALKKWNTIYSYTEAGWKNKKGYITIGVKHDIETNGKLIKLLCHRVVFALVNGRWPETLLDHRNGNPSDNRINNLEESNHSKNAKNSKPYGQSGYKNIQYDSRGDGKWRVRIRVNGKEVHIGNYKRLEDAIEARDIAYREHDYVPARDNPKEKTSTDDEICVFSS